ncbi:chaperonin 10-like protein [Xylogone sp. PMI_703]|nr:chaperonin 10-like protein [Xylogone sp. PMI_703]
MREVIVSVSQEFVVSTDLIDSPIPTPGPSDVLVKVAVAGSNPKDWKVPLWSNEPHNSGDDLAGTVIAVGENVQAFRPGDLVAAFHTVRAVGGAFAEYALAPEYMTFMLPRGVSFEEAATIPLAGMTAAAGLFLRLRLPQPWIGLGKEKVPLVVYGAGSAVGAFAVQLAKASGIGPIICVAGQSRSYVETLIDVEHGDSIIDYRQGDERLIKEIREALRDAGAGDTAKYVFDAISEGSSFRNVAQFVGDGSRVTCVHPPEGYGQYLGFKDKERQFAEAGFSYPDGVEQSNTLAGNIALENPSFGLVMSRYFTWVLQKQLLKGHPYQVVPGGLAGVREGLQWLVDGKASATKFIFRVTETTG